jgi:hypothetical protein
MAAGGDEAFGGGDAHGYTPQRGKAGRLVEAEHQIGALDHLSGGPFTRLSSAAIASTRPVRGS